MLIFEKILRNSSIKLRKTYDHCKAVLGNCEIDYTIVLYVNRNKQWRSFIRSYVRCEKEVTH